MSLLYGGYVSSVFSWATIVHPASLLLVLIFSPGFYFRVTGAMMMAVFLPPAVIIGTSGAVE